MPLIPIDAVRVGDRLRRVSDRDRVAALADSIAQIGLQHPISVCRKEFTKADGVNSETGYPLVAGLHRLEAHRALGLVEIEATIVDLGEVERQLWEIDENLCRADLTELEQGEHLLKRKEIYEWWRPETKHGGAPGKTGGGKEPKDDKLSSFADDTSTKTGIDSRAIQRSVRRAKKIDPAIRDRIRENHDIADSGVELDALASMTPADQHRAVALVEADQAGSIREAQRMMKPKAAKVTPHFKDAEIARQVRRDAFVKAWNTLDEEDREWARGHIEEAVADNAVALRVVG